MRSFRRVPLVRGLAALLAVAIATPVHSQDGGTAPLFKPEEIEQIVAPIALYPDALLAQVLMASTYPLEIVEAARWLKANPNVTGDALEQAMQQQTWDPSVKSLTAFPQVLQMMNDKLDWTQKLGDAFLAQQKDVMDSVQRLRAKAQEAGNLESNKEQKVIVEQPSGGEQQTTVIKIEQANPQVVYVPTYNPTVVYGAWPYPAYPPYYWYPAGYVATSMISFGVGLAVGSALWGGCNWGHSDVNINVNQYNNFNKTNINNNNWQHNVDHRKGVQYRDQGTQQKYGRGSSSSAASREAFRGRADQGRQQLAGGGADQVRRDLAKNDRAAGATRDGLQQKDRQAAPQRRDAGTQNRQGTSGSREPSAFKGMGNGNAVRQDSNRGHASRESASSWGSRGGGGGGGGRGGGGGGRAGGGGGGRAGGGGGRRR